MSSTFGSYSIASSGMNRSQAALSVISNNVANVNTAGASRQRIICLEQNIVSPNGSLGMGTGLKEISRVRDELLDNHYRQKNSQAGYWAVKTGNLEYMQELLGEFEADDLSGTPRNSLKKVIDNFFNSWSELAKDPTSLSDRETVTATGVAMIDALAQFDKQLQQLQQDICDRTLQTVAVINDLAGQIAGLNRQILEAEAGGGEASYLRDQRDSLLDELSTYTNIEVSEDAGRQLKVSINGVQLVYGDKTHTLEATGDGSVNKPLELQWAGLNCKANISSGALSAYLNAAQQNQLAVITGTNLPYQYTTTGAKSDIDTMRQGLNDLITTLAVKINALHNPSGTGDDFFVTVDSNQPLSISNIAINPSLLKDASKVAPVTSGQTGNATTANKIYQLSSTEIYQIDGGPANVNSFYGAFINWLGTAGEKAGNSYDTQAALAEQVEALRQQASGISMDEETANMIMYQHAYSANARILNTIDNLLAGLIEDLTR